MTGFNRMISTIKKIPYSEIMYDQYKKTYKSILYALSPEKAIKRIFKKQMGYDLNLDNPCTFNEKIQWLKLYWHNSNLPDLVDKYKVREYIKDKIGEKYLVPLISTYEKIQDVDFDNLPECFVIKPNHGSGKVLISLNKDEFIKNWKVEKKIMQRSLKNNYFYTWYEWAYKDIKPMLVCEELIDEKIIDYKFYCFNGEPEFLYVSQGLVIDHSLKVGFYDLEWNKLPFGRTDYRTFDSILEKPKCLKLMIDIARKLSKDFPFVRVDLYNVGDKVYFSELTFTPSSGYMTFDPPEYDLKIGGYLRLPYSKTN